jgi:hypothetical protein
MINVREKTIIRTDYIVDNSGRNFDDGRIKNSPMFLVPLTLEEALEYVKGHKRVYFVYRNFLDGKSARKVCKSDFYVEDHYNFYKDVCAVMAPPNKLTNDEYNVLNKLATASKMDCWFWLEDVNGNDYVRDLEENNLLQLTEAIPIFYEGLVSLEEYGLSSFEEYGLSSSETETAKTLFERFRCRR